MEANMNELVHEIFIYGTLKTGQPNHYNFEKFMKNGSLRLIGEAYTTHPYPLVIAGRLNAPFLLDAKGTGKVNIGFITLSRRSNV